MAERSRRASRISGDERQRAILASAEHLLEQRSLDDISIEDIAGGAGISRPSFYFYYSTKDDVLLALLDRVIAEVELRVAALPRDFATDPAAAWSRSIAVFVEVFAAHRSVSTAALAARARNAQVHDLWSRSMETWADYCTEVIQAERARGAAPAGIEARDLAIALNLMNERVLSAAFTGERPTIDQDSTLEVLSEIWMRSIYGRPVA
ncbi:MAG: TetR/AcrR family transcriptional regulator [Salinibacterium sp.]|nr:TetR/AcrR family transcriptional regulator [Salinibacterium sp.]